VTSATASNGQRAGRRRLPREARARQLLEVAEAVFAERGVQASSMEEIAEAAGVTKPILYDHYGSKDRLIAAVVLAAGSVLSEAVMSAVSAANSPEHQVAAGLRAYFSFIDERRTGLHSLLAEGVVPGSEAAAALEAVRDQQADLIAALLLQHSDVPDVDRAKIYAQIVIGATERLANRPGTESPPSVETLTHHVMDVIWCGFSTLRDGSRWEPAAD
jgi:AcrR family transcriptional regulator